MNKSFWKIEKRNVADLKDFSKNPRTMNKKNYSLLKENICKYGLIDRPFINTDGTILGGHVRTKILKELGFKEVEVFIAPRLLNEQEMKEVCIKHNKLSGEWDDDILANEYEFTDLMIWGFEGKELIEGKSKNKRKTKPKFVVEFSSVDDLSDFTTEYRDRIQGMIGETNAKIRLMGEEQ